MTAWIYAAALVAALTGIIHSYLGERLILIPLLRRGGLPKLFGSEDLCGRTLRFVWHLATVAFWGLAAVLVLSASPAPDRRSVLLAVALSFLASSTVTFLMSRGRHPGWLAFLFVGGVALWAALP